MREGSHCSHETIVPQQTKGFRSPPHEDKIFKGVLRWVEITVTWTKERKNEQEEREFASRGILVHLLALSEPWLVSCRGHSPLLHFSFIAPNTVLIVHLFG